LKLQEAQQGFHFAGRRRRFGSTLFVYVGHPGMLAIEVAGSLSHCG
jgi:hypothetical protein